MQRKISKLEHYSDSILSFSRNKNLFYSIKGLKLFEFSLDEDDDIKTDDKIVSLFKNNKIKNEKI